MILDTDEGRNLPPDNNNWQEKDVRSPPSFKQEAASLVLDRGYSVAEAREAVDVGETAMRRWVEQLLGEREGQTPLAGRVRTAEHQRSQESEARLRKVEREKEI